MRLPWNLVFTVFDLFESRMLWVKNCHDTISLQCKRKFDHHGIFQISPPEHCDRGFHKKVPQEWTATKYNVCSKMWHAKGQNATKCDRMMSHSVIFCLILSHYVAFRCIMSNFVAVHSGGPMKPGIWSDFVNKFLTDESFENFWDQW